MTKEVSLVDSAANNKKFIIIKRTGGIEMSDNNNGSLESIEKALNGLGDDFKEIMESLTKHNETETEDLEKAGSKFSKGTMAQLKSIRDAITKLLEGIDNGKEPTNKNITKEAMAEALSKGLKSSLVKSEDKETKIDVTKVGDIVAGVLEKLNVKVEEPANAE